MEILNLPLPACYGLTELFYSPEEDGRMEEDRQSREEQCKAVCFNHCRYRLRCLERALQIGQHSRFGVWGGMSEGERRRFMQHLVEEGYQPPDDVPTGQELRAALAAFYKIEYGGQHKARSV